MRLGFALLFVVLTAVTPVAAIEGWPRSIESEDHVVTLYQPQVETFDGIRQDAESEHGPGWIDRRYCSATAWLSNGETSKVVSIRKAGRPGVGSRST